jgi:3-hydroxy-3-methylglutaryl CoA synthase
VGLAVLVIGQTGCASIAKSLASLIERQTQGDGAARPVRAL